VLVGGIAVVGVAYLLARDGTISNWWLIVVTAAVVVAMPPLARRSAPEPDLTTATAGTPGAPAVAGTQADLPLELVGVARPYTVADREMLDAALGVPAGKA
jgi:hypothetical protein